MHFFRWSVHNTFPPVVSSKGEGRGGRSLARTPDSGRGRLAGIGPRDFSKRLLVYIYIYSVLGEEILNIIHIYNVIIYIYALSHAWAQPCQDQDVCTLWGIYTNMGKGGTARPQKRAISFWLAVCCPRRSFAGPSKTLSWRGPTAAARHASGQSSRPPRRLRGRKERPESHWHCTACRRGRSSGSRSSPRMRAGRSSSCLYAEAIRLACRLLLPPFFGTCGHRCGSLSGSLRLQLLGLHVRLLLRHCTRRRCGRAWAARRAGPRRDLCFRYGAGAIGTSSSESAPASGSSGSKARPHTQLARTGPGEVAGGDASLPWRRVCCSYSGAQSIKHEAKSFASSRYTSSSIYTKTRYI